MRKLVVFALACLAGCSQPQTDDEIAANNETLAPDNSSEGKLWTIVQYADRRSCPSQTCGVVGRLGFREAATPLEVKNGWTRTTKYYDGACENGRSRYVDKGQADCSAANGFEGGKFAEWVRSDQLSATRPPDPADTATDSEKLVAQSDDFNLHRATFAKVARQLIDEGRCTAGDFEEQGGWVKSVNQYRDQPVYFTYCGGMTAANKIYMNAATGTVM